MKSQFNALNYDKGIEIQNRFRMELILCTHLYTVIACRHFKSFPMSILYSSTFLVVIYGVSVSLIASSVVGHGF